MPRLPENVDERGNCLYLALQPPKTCLLWATAISAGFFVLLFLSAPDAFQNQKPNSCFRVLPGTLVPGAPANPSCSLSLSVHGSVLSLASSASSTYSSVRALPSLSHPLPFCSPPSHVLWSLLWLGNWVGVGLLSLCYPDGSVVGRGGSLELGALVWVPLVLSVLSGLTTNFPSFEK